MSSRIASGCAVVAALVLGIIVLVLSMRVRELGDEVVILRAHAASTSDLAIVEEHNVDLLKRQGDMTAKIAQMDVELNLVRNKPVEVTDDDLKDLTLAVAEQFRDMDGRVTKLEEIEGLKRVAQ